jgi:4-hydroxythreonine-4-phosphate dehydrogenase
MEPLPLIAITLGDPAGIGPEIVLKALRSAEVYDICRPLVVGDRRMLERAAGFLGSAPPAFELAGADPGLAHYEARRLTLLDLHNAAPEACPVGQMSAAAGRAAVEYVCSACDLAMAGQAAAVVTAPLNKAAMQLAGFHYAGHTELLAERTHAGKVSMLLVSPSVEVVTKKGQRTCIREQVLREAIPL